jgi:predicted glycogen debranching enzyme
MEHLDGDLHVLLSSLDLTVIQNSDEFNLGIHKYPGNIFQPTGHKYIEDFQADVLPKLLYRIGDVRIMQERLLVENEQQILIRFTVVESDSPLTLKFTPFLAFRNIHQLSKANMHAHTRAGLIENGVKVRLYDGYAWLYMQFSSKIEYVHVPDWYYNVEYQEEQKQGLEFQEDLFVPGYFEAQLTQGDSIVFSGSTKPGQPSTFQQKITDEIEKRTPRDNFKNSLINSAEQFIVKIGDRTEIVAGYHSKRGYSRDAFISLPGLTLSTGNEERFFEVMDTIVPKLKDGLFPEIISGNPPYYLAVDTPLWLFWCLQQYTDTYGEKKEIWKKYGETLKSILSAYNNHANELVHMQQNGLLYTGREGLVVTWMNTIVHGKAITPRIGCTVESNALWYNAICYAIELSDEAKDVAFKKEWENVPKQLKKIFIDTFWSDGRKYLGDLVNGAFVDWSVRPNQIIAAGMPYSPLTKDMKNGIVENVKRYLLTPRGLRTLSPKHPDYQGVFSDGYAKSEKSFHQGAAWPWLLDFYAEAYLQLHGKNGLEHIKKIISDLSSVVNEHGISSISEVYEGDPPYLPDGAISHAMNVAAVLKIMDKVEKMN